MEKEEARPRQICIVHIYIFLHSNYGRSYLRLLIIFFRRQHYTKDAADKLVTGSDLCPTLPDSALSAPWVVSGALVIPGLVVSHVKTNDAHQLRDDDERTADGRRTLLRARASSFAAGFQRIVDRRSVWL